MVLRNVLLLILLLEVLALQVVVVLLGVPLCVLLEVQVAEALQGLFRCVVLHLVLQVGQALLVEQALQVAQDV